jgi:peptidoglycan/xylan/chitin deacetylase (PgdA/CDA1 family)
MPRICLWHGLHAYPRTTTAWDQLPSCVTPSLNYYPKGSRAPPSQTEVLHRIGRLAFEGSSWAFLRGYGNINPLSIDYASRPRLRPRLTQGGLAWPWNPWSSGGRVSHSSFATHACILTRVASTTGSPRRFPGHTTLPYPSTHLDLNPKIQTESIM